MKVYRVADIVEGEILLCEQPRAKGSGAVGILSSLEPPPNPRADSAWTLVIVIGKGSASRTVKLDLPPLLSESDSLDSPTPLGSGRLVFFKNRLFAPEREPKTADEIEEVILRVKKAVYDEETEVANLRAAVANIEAALQYGKSRPGRNPIPEDVKLLVWARDGGACVQCGSKEDLQFDHIIPVSKGGGNSASNVQILCQPCNLTKSDKIANDLQR